MLYNKKGVSGVLMTVIMIALAIVIVGIVWAVVTNVVETQTETIDISQKCLGLMFDIEKPVCDPVTTYCNFTMSRSLGSKGDAIGGFGITPLDADGNALRAEGVWAQSIQASKTVSWRVYTPDTTDAEMRIHFQEPGKPETRQFCSQVFSSVE